MDNFEEELTCSICYNIFDDPRILPCSHTFCKNCLENVIRSSDGYIWRPSIMRLKCPSCRNISELSTSGILSLPINFALKSIIEKYKTDDHCKMATCPEHHRQPLNVFCLKDRKLVCGQCLTVGQHHGHPIDDPESAYIKERDTASKLLGILSDKNFTGVSFVIKKLEEQMDYCKNIVQEDKREVVCFFEKLSETMEEKKQKLLAALNEVNQQIIEIYAPQIEEMKQIEDEELDLISLSSSTQKEESPLAFLENIYSIHQRMKALKRKELISVHPVEVYPRLGKILQEEWLKTNAGEIHLKPIPKCNIRFDKKENAKAIPANITFQFILTILFVFIGLVLFIWLYNADTVMIFMTRYWTYLCEILQSVMIFFHEAMYTVKAATLDVWCNSERLFTRLFS